MATISEHSRTDVVLEAVRHASNANIPALRQLIIRHPDALKLELTLRILLTYLPTVTDPGLYIDLLHDFPGDSSKTYNATPSTFANPAEHKITDDEARLRVKSLRLTALTDQQARYEQDTDCLTLYLLRQAHRIDAETGSLELVTQLLESFVNHSNVLRTWMISILLPLIRLGYEYYGPSGTTYTLERFEEFDANVAVQSLLSRTAHRDFPREPDGRQFKNEDDENIEKGNRMKEEQRLSRDLRGLVGPWMYGEIPRKRRKLNARSVRQGSISESRVTGSEETVNERLSNSDWSSVNDWLLDLSLRDFEWSVKVIEQWQGPCDVDYGNWTEGIQQVDEETLQTATKRYAQAGLGAFYAVNNDHSRDSVVNSNRVIKRVAELAGLDKPPDIQHARIEELATSIASRVTNEYLNGLTPAHLLYNALLRHQNPLTQPTELSIDLALLFNVSCKQLCDLGIVMTNKSVAELCLFAGGTDQVAFLRRTLQKLKVDKLEANRNGNQFPEWTSTRQRILWLWGWGRQAEGTGHPQGVFGRIAKTDLEHELLQAMLEEECYQEAIHIYCASAFQPLPMDTVESTAINVALSLYDAASNCCRDRGGVLRASQIVEAFGNYFPGSKRFSQILALVDATQGISTYSLILQHGVPFRPVNIRAHKDPLSLIGKILEQNERSYTELDNLHEIGRKLLAAGLLPGSQQALPNRSSQNLAASESALPQRRIMQMAIEAALKQNDFDTAYSYLMTRLARLDLSKLNYWDESVRKGTPDDISWRIMYQVGNYNAVSTEKMSALRRIEQRMELLTQALLLAPISALVDILDVWRRCEQQLNTQFAREADEEERHDARGDRKVPGEFDADSSHGIQKPRDSAQSALAEEAPMGLFDVARGAATALSKSAFPLRGPQKGDSAKSPHTRPLSTASIESSDEGSISGAGGQGRVRKRDMVSSMVTGGLASGIGWVIGAPPVRQE